MCVCEREREREKERGGGKEKEFVLLSTITYNINLKTFYFEKHIELQPFCLKTAVLMKIVIQL